MKTKLIIHDSYLFLVDEEDEVKENTKTFKEGFDGDWYYNTLHKFIGRIGDITRYDFKIIAYLPLYNVKPIVGVIDKEYYNTYDGRIWKYRPIPCPIPYWGNLDTLREIPQKLEGVWLLPELSDNKEMEMLSENHAHAVNPKEYECSDEEWDKCIKDFQAGYKAAKQSDKKWTDDDIYGAVKVTKAIFEHTSEKPTVKEVTEKYLQSLNDSKLPVDFEIEIKYIDADPADYDSSSIYNFSSAFKPQPKVIEGILQGKYKY